MLLESTSPPVWDAKHLRFATDAAGVGLWSWNVDTDGITMGASASARSGWSCF